MSNKKRRKKSKNKNGDQKASRGFLPCFSRYLEKSYPLEDFYRNRVFVNKVSNFLQKILHVSSMMDLRQQGLVKDIFKITPEQGSESRRIIASCNFEQDLYRADWGDCPYRMIFGLDHTSRRCYVFILDATHDTYSGKQRR